MQMNFGKALVEALPRDFLLEFDEGVRAAGRRAKKVTSDLDVGKRSKALVRGQIRTALVEKHLVQAATSAGFPAEETGAIEEGELYIWQAFARIGRAIVVRATLGGPSELPPPNKTRKRMAEKLNAAYTGDLFRPSVRKDPGGPIAVFLVVTPNSAAEDGVGGINISVVDDRYDHYLFDEPLEQFLARYAAPAQTATEPPLTRRRAIPPYIAPEDDNGSDVADKKKKS